MADDAPTVLIVDDDHAVRQALGLLIESVGLATRGHASGRDFLDAEPPSGPACVLLDIRMPGMGGLEVQDRLREINPDLPVIFLTSHGDVPVAVRALKKGALDFLEKPGFNREELIERIQQALRLHGERLRQGRAWRAVRARLEQLSPREREVMDLVADGHANKVVAAQLGISERTVEIHRGRMMKKLGLRSVAELVRIRGEADHPPNGSGG